MPIEDPKLDSLCPGSREMETGRWEGQNIQLKEVQRLEEEEDQQPDSIISRSAG